MVVVLLSSRLLHTTHVLSSEITDNESDNIPFTSTDALVTL